MQSLATLRPQTSSAAKVVKVKVWYSTSLRQVTNPPTEVEVIPKDVPSNYNEKRINVNHSFISFTNLPYQSRSMLNVELRSNDSNASANGMDKVMINDSFEIAFHRTLRMPDDKRLHQLPASLGHFPLFNVEEYAKRLPAFEQGGLFFPIWQREAMWIGFSVKNYNQHRRYALRVFVGRVNAVSGLSMEEKTPKINDKETKQDYFVVPQQKWVDGIGVAPGVVRQFVAIPRKCISTVLLRTLWQPKEHFRHSSRRAA